MLSYLVTTAHITGEEKYLQSAKILIEAHGYLQNAMNPKTQRGVGTGNQSDDEMAFMSFYNFLKYCQNPDWNNRIALALWSYWRLERPERNPFFNIVMAACTDGTFTDAWGTYSLEPTGAWLQETLFTLKRFPLDRANWRHENSHRLDVVRFDEGIRGFDESRSLNRGRRIDGFALPVDERHFDHWNHDPWRLDTGGDGKVLSDGTVFLLPYYMGLYHGLFEE